MRDPGSPQSDSRATPQAAGEHEVTCQLFVELVTDYLEGALAARELTRVEEHLVICELCGFYLDQIRQTLTALGQLETPHLAEPSEQLLAALHASAERAE
jgi:predicted anti-sigma-YlaC factor YlaD